MYHLKKLYANLNYSLRGLSVSMSEHSIRLELLYLVFNVAYCIITKQTILVFVVFVSLALLVIMAELLNTAIELLSNKICPQKDEDIRNIKDIASAAVFVTVIINICAWVWLLMV